MIIICAGAFGMVHKGEMRSSDGDIKAVAIKTIKCKLLGLDMDCAEFNNDCIS